MKRDRYNFLPQNPDELKNMTDDEIRSAAWEYQNTNSQYAEEICRNCGRFFTSIDGDSRKAKILDKCDTCWKEIPKFVVD